MCSARIQSRGLVYTLCAITGLLVVLVLIASLTLAQTPSPPTTTAPGTVTILGGNLGFGHSWVGDYIYWTLDAPIKAGNYMAVAVSASAMTGKGVACEQPTSGASTTACSAITTTTYGVSSRTDSDLLVTNVWTTASRAYVTVRVNAAAMDVAAGSKRILTSVGGWSGGLPTKHAGANSHIATTTTFAQETTTATTTTAAPTTTTTTTAAPTTTAEPTTVATTTTTTTTSASPPTTTAPGTVTILGGNLGFGHSWVGDYIYWTLDAPIKAGNYMAVAVSASAMTGKGVACEQPTSGASTTACSAITTTTYGVSSRTDSDLLVTNVWTTASRAYVTVRVNAAAMDVAAGSKRILTSVGGWSGGLPTKHAGTNSHIATTTTFTQQGTPAPTTTTFSQQTTTTTTQSGGTTAAPSPTTTTTTAPTTTTTTTTTTAAPTTTPEPTTTVTNSIFVLNNNMQIGNVLDGGFVTWTMDAPLAAGKYMAVAVSDSAMTGKGVACVQPATGATTTTCKLITTSNYNAVERTDGTFLSVISASTSETRATVVVKVDAAAMGVAAGTKRVIFAIGTWSGGMVTQHATTNDRGSALITFIQIGTTTVAPPTTSGPPTTSTTTTTGAPTTSGTWTTNPLTPNAVSVLNGNLNIAHAWIGDKFYFTLDSPINANDYMAVSFSDAAMAGKGVACKQPATGTTTTVCTAITTISYNVQERTDDSTVTVEQAWTSNVRAYVTVSLSASKMGISTGVTSKRLIFAVGTWSSSTNLPTVHATSSDRSSTTLTLSQQTTTAAPPPPTTTAPGTVTILNGNLGFGHSWVGDYIYWTLDAPINAGNYMAVAVSASAMTGKGVACEQPTSGASTTACSAITTTTYGVSSRTDSDLLVTNVWTTASRAYVTVRVNAAAMDVAAGSKRILTSVGGWSGGLPTKHTGANSHIATTTTFTQQGTPASTVTEGTTAPATTSSAAPTVTGAAGSLTALNNRLVFTYDASSTPGNLTISMTSSDSNYKAFSWATSDTGMAGIGFACIVLIGTTPVCRDIETVSYNVNARTPHVNHIVSWSSAASGGWSITVTMPIAPLKIKNTGNHRVLFAESTWNIGTNMPNSHGIGCSLCGHDHLAFNVFSATTSVPTPAPPTTTSTAAPTLTTSAGAVSALNNKLSFTYQASDPANPTTGDATVGNLTITVSSSDAKYKALSWATSESTGMAGIGFACIVLNGNTPVCRDIETLAGLNVNARTPQVNHIVSWSSQSSGGWTVTVTMPIAPLNVKTGSRRVLAAEGPWNSGSNLPEYHGGSGYAAMLVNVFSATTAAPTPAPPTTTSTPAPPTTTGAPNTGNEVKALGGNLEVTWHVNNTVDSSTNAAVGDINITLRSKQANQYKAMSWATASSGMGGVGFACIVLSDGTPKCQDVITTDSQQCNKDATVTQSAMTKVVSAQLMSSGGGAGAAAWAWEMNITTPTKRLNLKDAMTRVLFAEGTWNTVSNMPEYHGKDGYMSAPINFFTGSSGPATKDGHHENKRFVGAMCLSIAWFIVLAIIGAVTRSTHENSPPSFTRNLQFVAMFTIAASFALVVLAAYMDYEEAHAPHPVYRAFGGGCCYLFSILLFPTTKMPHLFNVGHFAGSSYERFINFHVITGLSLVCVIITHFGMMLSAMVELGMTFSERMLATEGEHPTMWAFIALIMLLVMALTGLLRRKLYSLFRVMHLLFPFVLVGFCLHYPLLALFLIPGLCAYGLDLLYRWTTSCRANTEVVSVRFDKDSRVTQLNLKVSDPDYTVGPGQFALVTMSDISMIPHPFTIASFNSHTGAMCFYIRDLHGPFTSKFAELAEAGGNKIGPVSVSRPIGQLGIRLDAAPVIFLCAGGIGITPILSIANYIGREITEGNITGLHTVHIVWSCREDSLVEMVAPDIQKCIASIELRGVADESRESGDAIAAMLSDIATLRSNQTAVNAAVYKTGGKSKGGSTKRRTTGEGPEQALIESNTSEIADSDLFEALEGSSPRNDSSTHSSRSLSALVPRSRISTVAGRPQFANLFGAPRGEGVAVAVFSCGPAPFMAEVRSCANQTGCLLHEETFEL